VVLAGLLAALSQSGSRLRDQTFLFQGAGGAALGIANLLVAAMMKLEGACVEEARARIWMRDIKGLVVKERSSGGISEQMQPFAQDHGTEVFDLSEAVNVVQPSVLIGAAAVSGAFTPEVVQDMANFNLNPIILALSNPTSVTECSAEEVYSNSEGRAIFASGSPFPDYHGFGRRFSPSQSNNAYVYPGVCLGVLTAGLHHVPDSVFLTAAEVLAGAVTEQELSEGRIYPSLSRLREVSVKIGVKVAEEAYNEGTASTYPEPANMEEFITSQLYDHNYSPALPTTFSWPGN